MKYLILSFLVILSGCDKKANKQTKTANIDSTKYYQYSESYEKENLQFAIEDERIEHLKISYPKQKNDVYIHSFVNKKNRNDFFAYYRINKKYTGKLYPFEDKNIKIDSIRYWVSSFVSDTTAEFGSFYILNFRSKQKETIGSRIYNTMDSFQS